MAIRECDLCGRPVDYELNSGPEGMLCDDCSDDWPRQLNTEDVRRGLAFVLRSLDEEGWAIGHRGAIICRYAEQIGRALRDRGIGS